MVFPEFGLITSTPSTLITLNMFVKVLYIALNSEFSLFALCVFFNELLLSSIILRVLEFNNVIVQSSLKTTGKDAYSSFSLISDKNPSQKEKNIVS